MTIEPDDDQLMTVPEVAELLRVSTKYVYAKAARGVIPSFKVGAYVRFRRSEIEEYLEAGRRARHADAAVLIRRGGRRRA